MSASDTSSGEPVTLSLARLAHEFSMSRTVVSRKIKESSIVAAGRRRGYPVYALRDAWPVLLTGRHDIAADLGLLDGVDPKDLPPKQRLDWYRSERERLRLMQERGDVVKVEAHRAALAEVIGICVQTLETLSDLLERDCLIGTDAVARVERDIDIARTTLAERIGTVHESSPCNCAP